MHLRTPLQRWPKLPPTQGPILSALRLASSGVAGAWPLLARASTEAWALTKRALSQATASTAREGHNGVSFQHSDSNVSTCPSCPLPISSREREQRVSRLSSSFHLLFPDFKFPSRRPRSPLHVHDDRQLIHQSLINQLFIYLGISSSASLFSFKKPRPAHDVLQPRDQARAQEAGRSQGCHEHGLALWRCQR